jgi:predicted PurR-regulated permease PerM
MKDYWYIFLIAIFCAIFSQQIDNVMARVIKGNRNRIVFYCVFCAVMLGIICFLIYGALNRV